MPRKRIAVALVSMTALAACGTPDGMPGGLSFVLGKLVGASGAPATSNEAGTLSTGSSGRSGSPSVAAMTQSVGAFLAANQGPAVKNFPDKSTVQTLKVKLSGAPGANGASNGEVEEGLGGTSPSVDAAFFRAHPDLIQHSAISLPALHYRLVNLPTSIDLRPKMPPVRDQGPRGTCVMFSTAGIVDYLASQEKNPPIPHSSPEFMDWLYQIEVKKPGAGDIWTDDGTDPVAFHMVLRQEGNPAYGVPPTQGYLPESTCPYIPGLPNLPANTDPFVATEKILGSGIACQIDARQNFQSQGADFTYLPNDLPTMKAVLAAGVPIQIAIPVYPFDWYFLGANNHYEIPELSPAKWAACGGHSVALVGYLDDASAPGGGWFIMRNSWSQYWGDRGYCRLSYNYVVQNAWDIAFAQLYPQPFAAQYDVFPPPHVGPAPVVNTPTPTVGPTSGPTSAPTASPTVAPTAGPTSSPTVSPSPTPSPIPSGSPFPEPMPTGYGYPFTSITVDPTVPGGVQLAWTTSIPVTAGPDVAFNARSPYDMGEIFYQAEVGSQGVYYLFDDPTNSVPKTSGTAFLPYTEDSFIEMVAGQAYDYWIVVQDTSGKVYQTPRFTFTAPPVH